MLLSCRVSVSPVCNLDSSIVAAPSSTSPEELKSLPLPTARAFRALFCNVSKGSSGLASSETLLPLSKAI